MDYFKLIFFDLDGTLLDTAPDVHICVNLALQEMGLPKIPIEQTKKAIGPGSAVFSKIILGEENIHRFEEYRDIFRPLYLEKCLDHTKPFPGIVNLLEQLCDYKLVVLTNKPSNSSHLILKGVNLLPYFDMVVGADNVEHPKPHPDMVYYACSEMNISPGQCIVIGDTDNDILAANSAGAYSCLAGWGYSSEREKLKKLCDFYIEQPQDLLKILTQANVPEKKTIKIGI